MKRLHRFQQRMPMRYWLVPAAACLVVLAGAALIVQTPAKAQTAPAAAQAEAEKPAVADDAAEQRIFSGPQPGKESRRLGCCVSKETGYKSWRS